MQTSTDRDARTLFPGRGEVAERAFLLVNRGERYLSASLVFSLKLRGERLLYSVEEKAIYILNSTAHHIWELCDGEQQHRTSKRNRLRASAIPAAGPNTVGMSPLLPRTVVPKINGVWPYNNLKSV